MVSSKKPLKVAIEGQSSNLNASLEQDKQYEEYYNNYFIFPLKTKTEELKAFFNDKTLFPNFQKTGVNFAKSPGTIISEMNFNMYWNFRKFQVQNLQKFLMQRLKLSINADNPNKLDLSKLDPKELNNILEDNNSEIGKIINKALSKVGISDTPEERKKYLIRIIKLYEDVEIDVAQGKEEAAVIKKGGKELVRITENLKDNLNNMTFEIPENITKGKDKHLLDDAIYLMIDQTTR